MRGQALLEWIASVPAPDRDAAVEERLGLGGAPPPPDPPAADLVGYHASGVAPIVQMIVEVPLTADDVFVDLGSGLGKVALLAHLLTGARARGVELQPSLVERSRQAAMLAGVSSAVTFVHGDARDAALGDGTVFFLYLPFTGAVLKDVLGRLYEVAASRPIVVCALGLDLDRDAAWLVRRPLESFWLAIYDSCDPLSVPSTRSASALTGRAAEAIVRQR